MIVRDGWIKTNIRERLVDPMADFKVTITRGGQVQDFEDATLDAALEIWRMRRKLYLALSGGGDSMFVLDRFARAHIAVEPIIVRIKDHPVNAYETGFALRRCEEFGIKPIVIEIAEAEHLRAWWEQIFQPLNGRGTFSVPTVMAAKIAKESGGILLTGDGVLLNNANHCIKLGLNARDVYADAIVGEDTLCPFFVYSPEIARALVAAIPDDYHETPTCIVKTSIYGQDYRPKAPGVYVTPGIRTVMKKIASSRQAPQSYGSLENKYRLLAALSTN